MSQSLMLHIPICRRSASLAVLLMWPVATANALIVGTTPGIVPNTSINPASYPGWTAGDPGWNNIALGARQGIYLGDRWMLTARHVGAAGPTFETPTGQQSFNLVPGESFIVHNPPPALVQGLQLGGQTFGQTDLLMYRINGEPNLPTPQIAPRSQPLPADAQIVTIGLGRGRALNPTTWYVNTTGGDSNWAWSETPPVGGHQLELVGYKNDGNVIKRWGTNTLVNPSSQSVSDSFNNFLSDTTGVFRLTSNDGHTRNVIAMPVVYDNGGGDFESQAIGGDSGSSVFFNYGSDAAPQWKLAGIVNVAVPYDHQPGGTAIPGNATFFSDLSYYNQAYSQSICDIMKSCGGYSPVAGDVNIDGFANDDDVDAFVAGWMYNNGAGAGDYISWTKGDLNLDGMTNVADFILLRGALNGQFPAAAIASLGLGGLAVPEPSAVVLTLLSTTFLAAAARRRRSRAAR
jgi:hypothetical protein